jgi:hypothetical protein
MRTRILICAVALAVASGLAIATQQPAGKAPAALPLDTAAIQRALGRAGVPMGAVYRVAFPRTDLAVTVDGVAVRTGLALGGWAAFMAVRG